MLTTLRSKKFQKWGSAERALQVYGRPGMLSGVAGWGGASGSGESPPPPPAPIRASLPANPPLSKAFPPCRHRPAMQTGPLFRTSPRTVCPHVLSRDVTSCRHRCHFLLSSAVLGPPSQQAYKHRALVHSPYPLASGHFPSSLTSLPAVKFGNWVNLRKRLREMHSQMSGWYEKSQLKGFWKRPSAQQIYWGIKSLNKRIL